MVLKIIEVTIETGKEAYDALRIRGISDKTKASLLNRIAASKDITLVEKVLERKLYEGLPRGESIKKRFLKVLSGSRLPRHLLDALAQNPQGEAREKLLDVICQKAAMAFKALTSGVELSLEERVRLTRVSLSTKNYETNCRRAEDMQLDLPADVRMEVLMWMVKGGSHSCQFRLENKCDKPLVTSEERALFFKAYLSRSDWCKSLFSKYKHEQRKNFSDDELSQVLAVAVKETDCLYPYFKDCAEEILPDQRLLKLLSEEGITFWRSCISSAA